MLRHSLIAALAAVLLAPALAGAQDQQTIEQRAAQNTMPGLSTGDANHPGFVQSQHATDWRGAKLIGTIIYGPDNASIGAINDILISNDGKVRAVVIGVGGFVGVGEKNVAMPLDALTISRKPESSSIDKITVSYSKDDLKNAPQFAYDESASSRTTGSSISDKIDSLNPMNKTNSSK